MGTAGSTYMKRGFYIQNHLLNSEGSHSINIISILKAVETREKKRKKEKNRESVILCLMLFKNFQYLF